MMPPRFWQDSDAVVGRALAPLGWLYAEATAWRLRHANPWRAPATVICVGNLTAGGAGKTPVVRDLAARLIKAGRRPAILSRGYGGRLRGPLAVDPERHSAADVGDEPLLLARDAPCWIARDRAAGARAAIDGGADVILMDDGLQNPDLVQDLRLVVVDGAIGFGNGRALPAGPLRERIAAGLGRADALILIGEDSHRVEARFGSTLPVLRAMLTLSDAESIKGGRLIAFAGIGRPEKFRLSLAEAGAEIVDFQPFADHHPFTESELEKLADAAHRSNAALATTEKDWVRLPPSWRGRIRAAPVELVWRDDGEIARLLERAFPHV